MLYIILYNIVCSIVYYTRSSAAAQKLYIIFYRLFHMMTVCFSYDSHRLNDPQKDTVRNKFANTILFVEDYLCRVRSTWLSKDREQPKLTYQVNSCVFL